MSITGRLEKAAFAASVIAASVFFAVAPPRYAKAETDKQKSWIRSGTRYALAALEGRGGRKLPGKFSWFSSAREVRSLAKMNDTLWIGTEGGLFAYSLLDDAVSPVTGPASMSVRSIAVDDGGALWVGGDGGLSVRSDRLWRRFAEETHPFFGGVRCMIQGEARFWIGTYGNGCGYVTNDAITILSRQDSLLDERVLSIAEETPDAIFFGTASGLVSADTLGWKSLRYGNRLPTGAVTCMAFDEDRNLFLSIVEQGVSIYSFGRVRTFAEGALAPGRMVNALSLDPRGRVWAAGASGISIFDGTEWAPYALPGAANGKYRFLSMHHDAEGTCYLGTDEGTVLILSRDSVKEVAIPQAFPECRVSRVRVCNGTPWFIAGKNIYSYKASFTKVPSPPELYGDEMTDLLATETGEIWATTRFGILHFTGRAWEVIDRKNGLPTEYFIRVSKDALGTLWFVTFESGVVAYSAGKWTTYGRENGLPANAVEDAVVDGAGSTWIVTKSGEVARFAQGVWKEHELPRGKESDPDTARTEDTISQFDPAIRFVAGTGRGSSATGGFCLGLDKALNCLVGTRAGVYRFASNGWQAMELPRTMRGARPTAVTGSSKGEIWLGTAGNGLLVYRNGEWLEFGASNGPSDDYIRSLCEDQKGNIWIGTQFGALTRYAPQNGM